MTLPVLVINRDQDTDRLAGFAASAEAHGITWERIAAVDAHAPDFPFQDHAHLIGDHFWGRDTIKPGAMGCFLSHRLAWQRVAEQGAPAWICEDDARFHRPPPNVLPEGADVVFANDRVSAWGAAVSNDLLALAEVVTGLAALGGPKAVGAKPSPGTDCYAITPAGAARLLEITARLRITCGVDWAMVWSALPAPSSEVRAAFPELETLAHHLAPVVPPVSAIVLPDPVAGQEKGLPSTLKHAIERPIAELLRT